MISLFGKLGELGPIRQEKLDCLYSSLCKRYLIQMQVLFILTGNARNVTRSVRHSARKKEMDARRNVSMNRDATQRHFMVIIGLILSLTVLLNILTVLFTTGSHFFSRTAIFGGGLPNGYVGRSGHDVV